MFSSTYTYRDSDKKTWSCLIYKDGSITNLHGYCMDISTDVGTPPSTTDFEFSPLSTAGGVDMSCIVVQNNNNSLICNVLLKSPKIYEFGVTINLDNGAITKGNQIEYEQYGNAESFYIKSSQSYFATMTLSTEEHFKRVVLYKRTSAVGGSIFSYASVDLSPYYDKNDENSWKTLFFEIYSKPGETDYKLMIQDKVTTAVARSFNISDFSIEAKSIGYYEQLKLNNISLVLNNQMQNNFSATLYSIFYYPGSNSRDISDMQSTNYLTKYLWLWITIGSLLLLAALITVIYYCRRESIDKYNITL